MFTSLFSCHETMGLTGPVTSSASLSPVPVEELPTSLPKASSSFYSELDVSFLMSKQGHPSSFLQSLVS